MAKTKREIIEDLKLIDIVIELLDARIPNSSRNPDIQQLTKGKKKIILLNKCDLADEKINQKWQKTLEKETITLLTDSNSGKGIEKVLKTISAMMEEEIEKQKQRGRMNKTIRVMILGIPNVGKSSLLNRILGEERSIVSDVAGTTRDAIDSEYTNQFGEYILIDTAGIRKKSKVNESIEKFSIMRTLLAIDRADVCLVLIDATEGVTDQDAKILGEAHERGKGIILVVNKWDEIEKDEKTMKEFEKTIYNKISYATYAPMLFISAKTGQRVQKLFELINQVNSQNALRVSTSVVNEVINEAISVVQPPSDKGKKLKIFYGTQASTRPPTFVIFVNNKELFHFSYQRYLMNCFRSNFGLQGTPVRLMIREKNKKDASSI